VLKRAMGWFGVVAVCAVFGGCKSGDDDAAPISQDELPAAMASLVCDSLGECCSSAKLVFDSTNCRASITAQVKASLKETLTAGVKYDAEVAGACIAELKKGAKCGRTESTNDVAACDGLVTGTRTAGQACMSSAECAAPAYCSIDSITLEGTCVVYSDEGTAAPHGKAGDTCYASCEDESSCGASSSPGGVIGEPVEPAVVCYRDDSLYCNGTCQPLNAIGEPCDASFACKDGLFCGFDSGLCTAPHPNGATCTVDFECQSDHCDIEASTSTYGTCAGPSVTAQQCANGTR
jgi:hypothetical protein